MPKFRARPVEVEAMLVRKPLDQVAEWCGGTVVCNELHEAVHEAVLIPTMNGPARANHGDWIVKSARAGYFNICTPDMFNEVYEAV